MEQHVITSSCGVYTRNVWLLPGPKDKGHPLCIFLDAECYLQEMGTLPVICELMETGGIPSMTCLFVSYANADARLADFTCHDGYSRFIAKEVVQWARERNKGIQNQGHVVCGLSLSALAGAYITFQYPEVFAFSLCQSGSFWWLTGRDISLSPTQARFWLSVGDEETAVDVSHPPTGLLQKESQIEAVRKAVKQFESLGATTNYNLYSGGHTPTAWKEELAPALRWLLQS